MIALLLLLTQCAVPEAPAFSVSVRASTVSFAFRAAGVDEYLLEAGFAPGHTAVVFPIGSERFHVQAPQGVYYVRARARNSCGVSEPSPDVQLVIPCLGTQQWLRWSGYDGSAAVLRWTLYRNQSTFGPYWLEVSRAPGDPIISRYFVGETQEIRLQLQTGMYFARLRSDVACAGNLVSNEVFLIVP